MVTGTVDEDIHVTVAGVTHISRAVIQQIAHTVIKAEHGCRPG